MLLKKTYLLLAFLSLILIVGCDKDDGYTPTDDVDDGIAQVSPVIFDINAVPYDKLSDYNFFDGQISNLDPVYGVLPYELISPLFSDYSTKKRFVWMPDDVSAQYVDDNSILEFPTGTVLIKNFFYENVQPNNTTRLIETRLMIKKADAWIFANYKWNADQTEAQFDLTGGFRALDFKFNDEEKSVNYRIPSESECFLCHQSQDAKPLPIGTKPQNLNKPFQFSDGSMNQLSKLQEFGYLSGEVPSTIETVVAWDDTSESLEMRVRSYLDINCAHCHTDFGHCSYRSMRFDFKDTDNADNLGICNEAVEPLSDDLTTIIKPGDPQNSVLFARLLSNSEEVRMPLLGRSINHDEGIALIEQWINSLDNECN